MAPLKAGRRTIATTACRQLDLDPSLPKRWVLCSQERNGDTWA